MALRRLAKIRLEQKPPPPARSALAWKTMTISEFGRCGQAEKALKLFDAMPFKNQVAWNTALAALVNAGRMDAALTLFNRMPEKNATSYTTMIAGLSRSGAVAEARRLFDSVPFDQHNVFTWTALVSCYVRNSEPREAVTLFATLYGEFFSRKMLPNAHTFSSLLKACVGLQSLAVAMQVHAVIVKLVDEGGKDCVFVQNALIDVHAKLGKVADAERVFRRMQYKDLGSWNTMMDGYRRHMLIAKALRLFNSMRNKDTLSWNIIISGLLEARRGEDALRVFISMARSEGGRNGNGNGNVKPNASTYTTVLHVCSVLTLVGFGRQVHARVVRNGLCRGNVFVSNALISAYASCGATVELERVFGEMAVRDAVSWNSAIHGLGQNGLGRRALAIAERALELRSYNANTFVAVLTCCSHAGLVVEGLSYFDLMHEKCGIEPRLDHCICLIDLLGRAGRLEEAHDLLRSMPFAANALAWATLLHACLTHRNSYIGSVAARELKALQPDCSRNYERLARGCSVSGGNEETVFDVTVKEKKSVTKMPGCSWVI